MSKHPKHAPPTPYLAPRTPHPAPRISPHLICCGVLFASKVTAYYFATVCLFLKITLYLLQKNNQPKIKSEYFGKYSFNMNTLIIYPNSENQYFLLKSLLAEMKIKFIDTPNETTEIELTNYQKEILTERLNSAKQGNTKSRDEARKVFSVCLK